MLALVLAGLARPAGAVDLKTPLGTWTIGGYGEGYVIHRNDDDTQQQHPTGIIDLNVAGPLPRSAKFFLDTRFVAGGTPIDDDGFGVQDLSRTFQNHDPSLEFEEAYVDAAVGPVDLRVGKQKFAWGKLDTFHPTDILNPRKYTDPFVMDELDAKVGVPAAQVSYALSSLGKKLPRDLAFTLVWIPVPFPTRFPLVPERWFPPAIDFDQPTVLPPLAIAPRNPVVIQNVLTTRNRRPAQQLDEGAVALRLAGTHGPVDASLSYYDGIETQPAFDLTVPVFSPAVRHGGSLLPASPGDPIRLKGDGSLLPRFGRMHLLGADMATEVAGLTLRAEATWGIGRLLPRSARQLVSPENVLRAIGGVSQQMKLATALAAGKSVNIDLGDLFEKTNTIEWGIGADYVYKGWVPLAQINQIIVLEDVPQLLVAPVDTQLLLALRRAFLSDRLATEIALVEGLARGYSLGLARFSYSITDHVRVRLGYVFIAGSRESLIGQFHDNDQGFIQLRYTL